MGVLAALVAICAVRWLNHAATVRAKRRQRVIPLHPTTASPSADQPAEATPTPIADEVEAWLRQRG
jgi:hypothetical protein